jgi:hypothetical protein
MLPVLPLPLALPRRVALQMPPCRQLLLQPCSLGLEQRLSLRYLPLVLHTLRVHLGLLLLLPAS